MKKLFLIISILFCAQFAVAQSNIVKEIESGGVFGPRVKVNQPAHLLDLMGKMVSIKGSNSKVEGYRIVVYSGNNSAQARDEALRMQKYMRDKYPDAQAYVVFESPIRSCMYGDFRTKEEAEAVMYKLKATRKFKELYVRKCLVNLPY